MAMTLLEAAQVPAIWEKYIIEKTAELSAFGESGVVASSPRLDALASGAGLTVNMPFWQDLSVSGARQLMNADGTTPLVINGIGSDKDIAVIQMDAEVWGANLLAELEYGSDPMEATTQLIAGYWARRDEQQVIASAKGVFASAGMAASVNDIGVADVVNASDVTRLNGHTFVDSLGKLGDRADRLTVIAMHSATEASLRKLDMIDYVPESEGKPFIRTFQGRRVVVDDNMPVDGSVYTSYLFGPGAFGRGQKPLTGMALKGGFGSQGLEYGRTPLASSEFLINRRRYILHPRGVKWIGTAAGSSPTDLELAVGTNWELVYERKNVRMAQVKHNV